MSFFFLSAAILFGKISDFRVNNCAGEPLEENGVQEVHSRLAGLGGDHFNGGIPGIICTYLVPHLKQGGQGMTRSCLFCAPGRANTISVAHVASPRSKTTNEVIFIDPHLKMVLLKCIIIALF